MLAAGAAALCALMPCCYGAARTAGGGITEEMLTEIRSACAMTASDRALANAIAENSIDAIAKNHANAGDIDTFFDVETRKQSITDQQSSGRCWMFSGFNVLRAAFAERTDSLVVDFSHNYLFFWDQLEKANLFLQGVIDTGDKPMDDERVRFFFKEPVNDGGTFCGVADLADKYGLVPKSVMPETYSSDNTRIMARLVSSKLREYGLALRRLVAEGAGPDTIRAEKTEMLAAVWHILALTLGEPPTEFVYTFRNAEGHAVGEARTFTPQEFFREVVGDSLNGTFIMVMNDPRRPYYKTYEVEYDRHTYDGHNWKYVNLPMEEIEELAIASLKDGKKLYSSYDVGKMLDRGRGYADTENYDYGSLLGTTFTMTKAERISTYDSGSTHAMTLTAVDLDADGKAVKWKAENSWGGDWGQDGCLIMTDRWLREYMFRLVVDKKYVPENILRMSRQEPVMVMPEDPLFQEDM